jgi:hypothetical protein
MKYIGTLLVIMSLSAQLVVSNDPYRIIIEPLWQDLDTNTTMFENKWILIGSITFEKRPKDPVTMHRLHLKWQGQHLEHLTTSLYRKIPDKDFYPLESNLVCDGIWCQNKQTVILTFNEEKTLGPRTIFYFVVTINPSLEPILKKGRFLLVSHTLPESFRPMLDEENLCLSLDAINSVTTFIGQKE